MIRFLLIIFILSTYSSCATLQNNRTFSTENIMKLNTGMSSNKILKMFGVPKNVSQSVCGAATGNPWKCTIWEYGSFPYDRATFTFSGENENLILNNFNVERQ